MTCCLGGAVILWLAATSTPELEPGAELPAGLHSAAVIIEACDSIDGLESELSSTDMSSQPIRLAAPVTISRENLRVLHVALKLVGIYRIDFTDKQGKRFAYVTRDPRTPPPQKRNFEVEVISIKHVDVSTITTVLKQKVAAMETDVAEEDRTIVAGYAKTRRVVIRYTSVERLEEYKRIIASIDKGRDQPRIVLRRYTPRHKRSDDLKQEFDEQWEKTGEAPVNLVAARATHVILVRVPEEMWEAIRELLETLDRPD